MRSLIASILLTLSACTISGDCPDGTTPDGTTPDGTTPDATTPTPEPAPLSCSEIDRELAGEASLPTGQDAVTLSGVYRVSGTVTYDGGEVVTIEPGTVFLMEAGASVRFGWRSDPAAVFAEGTPEAPILFCGTSATPGHWSGVELLGGTREDSVLRHVVVEDAGLDDTPALAVMQPVDLVSVELADNAGVGLYAEALGAGSADLRIAGNGTTAHLLNGDTITNLPDGDYAGNDDDVVLVSSLDNEDVVFHDRGVPYRQTDDRVVYGPAGGLEVSVTYEAGVVYELCQDCSVRYGWRGDPAVVQALGTPSAPVVFTSDAVTPQPGDWDGLHLDTGLASDSRFENVVFEFGGKAGGEEVSGANLVVNGGLGQLIDCTFADSAGYGLWLERVEPGFVESGSLFVGNGEGDRFENP